MPVQHLIEEKLEEKFGRKTFIVATLKRLVVKDEFIRFLVKTEFISFYMAN